MGISTQSRHIHVAVSVGTLIKGTCFLPLFGTIVCVFWSLMFNFEAASRIHCGKVGKVYNFLPSISAAIGDFSPQRYIWRICIALHAPQRLFVAIGYYGYLTAVNVVMSNELFKTLAAVCTLLHIVEVISLVGLSMISSSENFEMHKTMFISFMGSALLHMLLTIFLMRWSRFGGKHSPSIQEIVSLRYKTRLFVFNLSVFTLALYLYYRHNTYCESGVYSFFALCEYLVVVSNIGFHSLAIIDFHSTGIFMMDFNPHTWTSVSSPELSPSGLASRRDKTAAYRDLDSLMVV